MLTVRASALTSYADCFRRGSTSGMSKEEQQLWGFDPRFDTPTISSIMGTLIHRAAEADEDNLREKLKRHVGTIRFDKTTPDIETAARQCARMVRVLHEQAPGWRNADLLECAWEAEIFGVMLTGHPDRVGFVGDGECEVHDLKTSAWPPGYKHSAQLGGYALLAAKITGRTPTGAFIHHVPRTVMSREQEPMTTVSMDVNACADHALMLLKQIRAHEGKHPTEMPCNPSSTLCRKEWCPAYQTDYCPITIGDGEPTAIN